MTPTSVGANFSGLEMLARVLRKPIVEHHYYNSFPFAPNARIHDSRILKDGFGARALVQLNFALAAPVKPENIQISVLPIVLETSSSQHWNKVCSTITHPSVCDDGTFQAVQSTSFHTLRVNVAEALRDYMAQHPRSTQLIQPEIWVNGLCEVVEVRPVAGQKATVQQLGTPEPAITVKDRRCKSTFCKKCRPRIFRSFFPFENSATATLHYLRSILSGVEDDKCAWADM